MYVEKEANRHSTQMPMLTQITALYNCGEVKSMSERTTLRWMEYNASRRAHPAALLSAMNRNLSVYEL